jgi:hypothetical protein
VQSGIGGVAQERAFPFHFDEVFCPQLVQVMGESRVGDSQLLLISLTTKPSGWVESSNFMMRRRGAVPMAENMSAYSATAGEPGIFLFL